MTEQPILETDIRVYAFAPAVPSDLWDLADFNVTVTHLPTGVVVIGSGKRSHRQNRESAIEELRKVLAESREGGWA